MTRAIPGAVLLGILAGCASPDRDRGFDDVRKLVEDRIGVAPSDPAELDADDVAARVREWLREPLTADVAVHIALVNDARLLARIEDLGVARAEVIRAGVPRNPTIEAEIRFPDTPFEIDVMQSIVDLLRIPGRTRIAKAQLEATKHAVAGAILDAASGARAAFYRCQAAEQAFEMRRTIARATLGSLSVARERRKAGNATDLELASEQALHEQAKLELALADAERAELRESLNRALGLFGANLTWTVEPRLPDLPAGEIALDGLESLAIARRPDLEAARDGVSASLAALGYTRDFQLLPDGALVAHVEKEPGGETTAGPGIQVELPLFDRGQATITEADSHLRRARLELEALAVEIRAEVRSAWARASAASLRARRQRDVLVPLRARIVEQTQLQQNAMQIGVAVLLQAKQSEIDAGRAYVEALRDYWIARSELERAVGGRIPETTTSRPRP
ncbi:MAG TPA: TolC family protein [Planctomycetota bacterium]|nr:TolC family protein [Planctomycetota bacterium]